MDRASGLHLKQANLESTYRERRPKKVSGGWEGGKVQAKCCRSEICSW